MKDLMITDLKYTKHGINYNIKKQDTLLTVDSFCEKYKYLFDSDEKDKGFLRFTQFKIDLIELIRGKEFARIQGELSSPSYLNM